MKWSWRIATIAGIGVYLHATFLLLLAFIVYAELITGGRLPNIVATVLFLAAVFTIVVLHELGHALAARRYGIKTRDITLLPIGGVARLERMPEDPKQEVVVAIAGPAVNVVLAALCALLVIAIVGQSNIRPILLNPQFWLSMMSGRFVPFSGPASFPLIVLQQLLFVNVVMVAFNLLPAFPMDGGRVLRAVLSMRINPVTATRLAAGIGQMMAVLFVIFALLSRQPMLIFVAMFVWFSAEAEAADAQMRSLMKDVTAKQAMVSNFHSITPASTLHDVSLHVVSGFQQDFPVVDGNQVVGILTRRALLQALRKHGQNHPVATVMVKDFQRADIGEALSQVYYRLSDAPCRVLPIMDEGRLVGMIDMENVGEFIALRAAIRAST